MIYCSQNPGCLMLVKYFFYKSLLTNIKIKIRWSYPLTRNRSNLEAIIPLSAKNIGQRSYIFLSPHLYNTLPIDKGHSKSSQQFKSKCKVYILNLDRYFIHSLINVKKIKIVMYSLHITLDVSII